MNLKPSYRIPIPLQPSKTGPPTPEKMIIPARTGPPALPVKPKLNNINNRYPEPHPFRQYHYQQQQQQQQSQISIDTNDGNTKPLPITSPASMLHIPAMVSRTTTGNSSTLSSTSTSSQNSTSTNSKRGWNISSWFSNQQQQLQMEQHENLKNSIRRPDSIGHEYESISPQLSGTKRTKVIQELLETEKAYQKDMSLLKKIYYDGACLHAVFSKSDIRHLFSNLIDIVEFEKTFVSLLEHSCEQDSVGTCFREIVIYCLYIIIFLLSLISH